MRKSIKRIVSTVLAATMVLTSSVVSNVSIAAAGVQTEGIPFTVDTSEVNYKLDQAYTGEVTVEIDFDITGAIGGKGSLLRLRSSDNFDHEAALRVVDAASGATVLGKDDSGVAIGNTVLGNNKLIITLNTETGEIKANYNGTEATRFDNATYIGKDVNQIKFGTKTGRQTVVNSINVTATGGSVVTTEATTEATTVEVTTEATTVATTEAVTETVTEVTTEAVTAADGEVIITPEYTLNGDTLTVKYNANVGANTGFNNYTMFLTFDPSVLTPVSAADGDIVYATKDSTGADINVPASNAKNIEAQFANVPAAGNTDFAGADGNKTQADLGKVKVAYCIFDKDFSQAASGSLPAFTTSGTLFTVTYKVNGEVNGTKLGTAVGTLNTVSSDAAIQNTAKVTANDVTIGGGETPTESTTTEATTKETTTEATTEAVTGLAIVGDTVTAKDGKATVTFSLKNNTLGVANYDVFVKYNSSDLIATGGTTPGFNNTGIDVVNVQVKYVPVTGDSDYDGKADGKSTAAEIGILKLSVLNESNVTSDAAVLTVDFDVKATAAGTYPVEITIVSMGDESGKTYTEYQNVDGAVVIEGSTPVESTTEATTVTEATTKVTTEATTEATTKATTEATTEVTTKATTETTTEATETTTRSYHGGGGGGGGSTHNYTTTTTEAATEAVTDSDTEPTTSMAPGEVVINDGTSIKVPTDKVPNFEGFEDLNNYPWAEDSINKLAELGIITGVADKTYGPALPCRRADFAILINRTLGVTVDSVTKNFSDNEDQSKYYYNDLRVGYTAGILSGYGDNNYKPEQYCTREEMAVLVAKTFEWLGKDVTSTALSVNDKYTDVDNISWWSAPYVAYLTDMGIINGNADGTLLPKNYINRAEMAVMMSKVYDYALDYAQSMTTTTTEATTEETTVDETSTETTTVEETSTETTTVAEDF